MRFAYAVGTWKIYDIRDNEIYIINKVKLSGGYGIQWIHDIVW